MVSAFIRLSRRDRERFTLTSADVKPSGVAVGTLCFERDTQKWFITSDGSTWVEYRGRLFEGRLFG